LLRDGCPPRLAFFMSGSIVPPRKKMREMNSDLRLLAIAVGWVLAFLLNSCLTVGLQCRYPAVFCAPSR
jgi:hypothetical protein